MVDTQSATTTPVQAMCNPAVTTPTTPKDKINAGPDLLKLHSMDIDIDVKIDGVNVAMNAG